MSSELVGKWKLVSSEKFDEFLKEMGVGMTWRTLASNSKPTVEIAKNGDEWKIKTSTMLKTSELKFKVGEEFEESRMDGVNCKTVVNADGDKLVQKQFGEKEVTITREVEDGALKVTCSIGDITAIRKYAKN